MSTNDTTRNKRPFGKCYWLCLGWILAGEYPAVTIEAETRKRLRALLQSGISLIVDLTEDGELPPYDQPLHEEAQAIGTAVEHLRLAIKPQGTPLPSQMRSTLDVLDTAVASSRSVYIHYWTGTGRTGLVAGCYLARHGVPPGRVLEELRHLRQGTAMQDMRSPETPEQRSMVQNWRG